MTTASPAAARSPAELVSALQVVPSILAADFARLGEHVTGVLEAGAQMIHCDVMDGHFVPPVTFGTLVVSAVADLVHAAGGLVDVHLMIERPERTVAEYARAGADVITIHAEATPHVHYALSAIRDAGCLAGVAINPASSPGALAEAGRLIDVALCMTVNPGWGGQRFIDATLDKIARVRELLPEHCALEVDGGIDVGTAPECVRRGANLLVAGSAIFREPSPADAYRELIGAAASV